MRNNRILDALLPKTRQGILAALLGQPDKSWFVSHIVRRMGVPSSSLQRELQDLTEAGILKSSRQGRMVYYQANAESPVFAELRGLLLKTAGLAHCRFAAPASCLGARSIPPCTQSRNTTESAPQRIIS